MSEIVPTEYIGSGRFKLVVCENCSHDDHQNCSRFFVYNDKSVACPCSCRLLKGKISKKLTPEDIVAVCKEYSGLSTKSWAEAVCQAVECPYCGAKKDEGCKCPRVRTSRLSLHVARKDLAFVWRKKHIKEWEELKDAAMLKLVKEKMVP